jgi:UDP-N-acetylglucosamine 4,6-dehydratase
MKNFYRNKTILITGGTGSFGKRAVKHLLNNYELKKIIIFSRDEQKHHRFNMELNNSERKKVRFFLGDVRDKERLIRATKNVNYIIHAAAMKHVYLAEYNPNEAIKTNIIGTQNVIDSSLYNNCDKMILLSTDKAVEPINLYGATKLAAEKIVISSNSYASSNKTRFSIVRYGNVIGSEGSVIQKFKQIASEKSSNFEITSEEMTRFWINFEDAIQFVLKSLKNSEGGEIFIPKMLNFKITDIARALNPNKKIKFIGTYPGEKNNEKLITEYESLRLKKFKDYFIIYPEKNFVFWDNTKKNKIKNLNKIKFEYKSDQKIIINPKIIKKTILN